MKLLIIGGVAGGAAAAARARRLDEKADIVLLERGEFVSFANCGLPYYAGEVIRERKKLLVQTPEGLGKRFNIDVRTRHEALSIDTKGKKVEVKNHSDGTVYQEAYDNLILSPGAEPFIPPVPGSELDCIYKVRTIPDIDKVKEKLDSGTVKKAIVVGAGFIGIEMAENIRDLGIDTTLVEMLDQVMPPFDREMASVLHRELRSKGVRLKLNEKMTRLDKTHTGCILHTESGAELDAEMVVMSVGIRPEIQLARDAGLEVNYGIKVDKHMRTSDPNIYAVGDAVENLDPVTGTYRLAPLAGPAAKQARAAVNTIFGRETEYEGTLLTAVVKIFSLTAAITGPNERTLKKENIPYEKIFTHPANHAGYYPGAVPLCMKVLFDPEKGTVLGAQVIGAEGADKRIDILAAAVKHKLTVRDLGELELAYAPPYGSAKDAVNLAGMAAQNHIEGLSPLTHWDQLTGKEFLLDVRTPDEFALGSAPDAVNIPVDELRDRLEEVPKDRDIAVFCQVGIRAHAANRILLGNGYTSKNISGGYKSYLNFNESASAGETGVPCDNPANEKPFCSGDTGEPVKTEDIQASKELDLRGLQCPGPIIQLKLAMAKMQTGEAVKVLAGDPGFAADLPKWCTGTRNRLLSLDTSGTDIEAVVQKGDAVPAQGMQLANKSTIVVFSEDLDKAYASFIIARGAAASGRDVTMFFTFWGLNLLKKKKKPSVKKDMLSKMFGMMMPSWAGKTKLSKLNMGGMGTGMMKHVMKKKGVEALPDMIHAARNEGIKLVACSMTMDVMGIDEAELLDGVEIGGVAYYIGEAAGGGHNLFI